MEKFKINIHRELTLTTQDIDDIMVSALEGGINYWCSTAEVVGDYYGEWASEQIARGGKLKLYDIESDDVWELTRATFLTGFRQWFEDGCDRYSAVQPDGTVETGQIDALMADMIVQYALFGEVVFG